MTITENHKYLIVLKKKNLEDYMTITGNHKYLIVKKKINSED